MPSNKIKRLINSDKTNNSKRKNNNFQKQFLDNYNNDMYNLVNSNVFNISGRNDISKLILLSKYHETYKDEILPREILRELNPLYDKYLELKSKDLEKNIDKKYYANLFKNNIPLLIFRTIALSKIPLNSDKELLVNCFGLSSKNFEEERKNLAERMLELYSPVSDIFGFKNVLESIKNTSVEALYPENYGKVNNFLLKKKKRLDYLKNNFETFLQDQIDSVKELIHFSVFEDGSKVKGRIKSPGSIVLKMIDLDKPASKMFELHDLIAFTVLVENIEDARSFWGLLKYEFNSEMCEDFISSPRSWTGYQALHVDVYFGEVRVEVQVKTPQMYLRSEKGDWSHAVYKNKSMREEFLKLQEFFSLLENSSMFKNDFHLINTRGSRITAHYVFDSGSKEVRLDKNSNVFDLIISSKVNRNPFKVKAFSKNTGVEMSYTQIVRDGGGYVLKQSNNSNELTKKELYDLRACCVSGDAKVYLTNLIKKK